MQVSFTFIYRVSALAILAFLVGELSEALRQGTIGPSSTNIVIIVGAVTAIAEGAMAIVLLITAHIEGSSFLWTGLTSTTSI